MTVLGINRLVYKRRGRGRAYGCSERHFVQLLIASGMDIETIPVLGWVDVTSLWERSGRSAL